MLALASVATTWLLCVAVAIVGMAVAARVLPPSLRFAAVLGLGYWLVRRLVADTDGWLQALAVLALGVLGALVLFAPIVHMLEFLWLVGGRLGRRLLGRSSSTSAATSPASLSFPAASSSSSAEPERVHSATAAPVPASRSNVAVSPPTRSVSVERTAAAAAAAATPSAADAVAPPAPRSTVRKPRRIGRGEDE